MRRVRHLVAVGAVAIGAIAIGDASPASAEHRALSAILNGANEVPPADPDGFGLAGVLINTETDRICYVLAVRNVDAVIAAHIHSGVAGVNGDIVVRVESPDTGLLSSVHERQTALTQSWRRDRRRSRARVLRQRPQRSVHRMGAVRGQLG